MASNNNFRSVRKLRVHLAAVIWLRFSCVWTLAGLACLLFNKRFYRVSSFYLLVFRPWRNFGIRVSRNGTRIGYEVEIWRIDAYNGAWNDPHVEGWIWIKFSYSFDKGLKFYAGKLTFSFCFKISNQSNQIYLYFSINIPFQQIQFPNVNKYKTKRNNFRVWD